MQAVDWRSRPERAAQAGVASPTASLIPVAVGSLAAALVAAAPQIFNDGDTFMHVAAGLKMLQAHAVLTTDPFSFTFGGRPWQVHEWLAEIVMALAYRLAGWSGVALLTAAAFGLTAGLMTRHVGRWLSGAALVAAVTLGLASLASSLLARPHILALPFLEMWAAELVIARSEGQMPDARRLVPLMAVWANLHGSFLFGLALAGAFGLEAVIKAKGAPVTILRWAGLGIACLAAAMISPHGVDNVLFPFRLMGMKTLHWIGEWSPMAFPGAPAFDAAVALGAFALFRARSQLSLLPLLLSLLLVALAISQVRHVLLFGVIAPLLIAEPAGRGLKLQPLAPATPTWTGGFLAAGLAAAIVAARLAIPVGLTDRTVAPVAALAHVPANLRGQPVLNTYAFGGYLIFAGERPYIDSRAEVYGDAFRARYLRLAAGEPNAVTATLSDPRIRWSLTEPGSPLTAALDRAPGWTRLYADRIAVVHARTAPPG